MGKPRGLYKSKPNF